jgi:hypothetical protein
MINSCNEDGIDDLEMVVMMVVMMINSCDEDGNDDQ